MSEEQTQITIEDLELSLEVYEIQSEQKLAQLKKLFQEKGSLDLSKVFYQERSTIKIKFQNIITDLIQFLVKQEVATTQKLRKTFYRILQNPLLLLFKISRFEIFDLRLNGFDIQLEPIEAICELGKTLNQNITDYLQLSKKQVAKYDGKQYPTWNSYLEQAMINMIQDKIFVFYSYLRKGSNLLKKKFENKVKIVEIFNNIENKLFSSILKNQDKKTLKQLSVLNYEIYSLEQSFDVLNLYLQIPFRQIYKECFQQFELLSAKAKKSSNYNMYILQFTKYGKQIIKKITSEKIDPCYENYIENAIKAILEMWGCRMCYYQQFCDLFTILFDQHPNQVQILEICLKHTPKMQKDDIVLLRTNFKLEMAKKHSELLSLMKSRNLEEINDFLNSFYHRTFYNMNFGKIERQDLIKILTLMNGNSSLKQFFNIVQRSSKQWNHTIDFSHSHKFIEGQFAYPKLNIDKIKETIKLLTNLCLLEEKGFNKEYEELIRANTIGKILSRLVVFINNDKSCAQVQNTEEVQNLIVQSFFFLRKCLNPSVDAELFVQSYANLISQVKDQQKRIRFQKGIISYTLQNIEHFHIHSCIQIFSQSPKADASEIIEIFFKGINQNNKMTQNFRFLDLQASQLHDKQITEDQANFILKHYVIKNGILAAKDSGIFKLTEFEVMTNPIQFQKVMDNFYFTLDPNSKKFIEYLIAQWYQESEKNSSNLFEYYSKLITQMIVKYPVSIPLLASTRIQFKQQQKQSKRFSELLALWIGTHNNIQSQILEQIININCIRYRNGKDYVQEQILSMILKQLINNINQIKKQEQQPSVSDHIVRSVRLISRIFIRANLKNIKSQTIQKTIEKIKYLLKIVTDPLQAQSLSESHDKMMRVFFRKKQVDMRKSGLGEAYEKITWTQTRNYTSSSNTNNEKQCLNQPIPQQILVSPYTISQDFNIKDFKIKNIQEKKKETSSKNVHKKFSEISGKLQKVEQLAENVSTIKSSSQKTKNIHLKNSKHNLISYMGEDTLQKLCDKENFNFIFEQKSTKKTKEISPSSEKQDQNHNFVLFYLKQFQIPTISHKVILQDVIRLLKSEDPTVSHTWTNYKNLQYYFMDLFSIFQYAALQKEVRNAQKAPEVQEIIKLVDSNQEAVLKKVLLIFEKLGYSNIWAESLNMFWINFPIRKHLGLNKPSQQSILSMVLGIALKKQSLRDSLNNFLGKLFETRRNQTALMYKVAMDKNLMNLVMKSLQIQHLNKISLLFHSNFNNLRLYTDQLHEGLKALNMASINRSYNQYIKLSKTIEDEEFEGSMKLFRQNFSFFIRIQKQGYVFKKNQQKKLIIDRLNNLFRTCQQKQNIASKVDGVLKQYIKQIQQLQLTIANRVRSFYLVTKLRDLSYQNSLMISILQSVMKSQGKSSAQILDQIKKVQIFSLMNQLYNQLIVFEDDWRDLNKYSTLISNDENKLYNQLTICSTRRYSHSMSKIYEKCDLQFDEVIQRCFNALKVFFSTQQGQIWIKQSEIYPAFLIRSFIDQQKANKFVKTILDKLCVNKCEHKFEASDKNLIQDLVKGFRNTPRQSFTQKTIEISVNGKKYTPATILPLVVEKLVQNQTLTTLKSTNYLLFNKYKTSEATLQEIQILGYIISNCLLTSTPLSMQNPFHPSLISCLSFNISDFDYLLDIDFKIWQELKNVLSHENSANLQLNFSYNFESLETFKPIRIQLVDKGSSKKVNNLNREEYCDSICSYILYENLRPQIDRLLSTILKIVPKQYICCLSTKQMLSIFYNKQKTEKLISQYMQKIGVVLPETIIDENGKRYENLKDFQNIQWLQELILENAKLRQKYWKDQTNIFIVTHIGSDKGSIRVVNNGQFLVEHFRSKEDMKSYLNKLV